MGIRIRHTALDPLPHVQTVLRIFQRAIFRQVLEYGFDFLFQSAPVSFSNDDPRDPRPDSHHLLSLDIHP